MKSILVSLFCCINVLAFRNIRSFCINNHQSCLGFHENYKLINSKHFSVPRNVIIDEKIVHKNNDPATLLMSLKYLWQFSRPHTVIGSFISIISLFAFAVPRNLWTSRQFLYSLCQSIVPSLFMNLYITGLNQISDVDIDKLNKPYLPIASGKMSIKSGIWIVSVSLLMAFIIGFRSHFPLQITLLGSAILGTLYSLPPFRLKRFPLLAAFCILVVRGSLINLGFFFQAKRAVLGQTFPSFAAAFRSCPESVALTLFYAIFGLVIALMKDVPDVQGDKKFNIMSFSVKVGPERMFLISWQILFWLLCLTSGGLLSTILSPAAGVSGVLESVTPLMIGRVAIASILFSFGMDVYKRAIEVDAKEPKKVFSFYMYVWNIFYACYLVLPLATLS